MTWRGVLAAAAAAAAAVVGTALAGGEALAQPAETGAGAPICDPSGPIYQPPIRKGGVGRLLFLPPGCRGASGETGEAMLARLQAAQDAEERRADPIFSVDGTAAVVDLILAQAAPPVAGEATEAALMPGLDKTLDGAFHQCLKGGAAIVCQATWRRDAEAGRRFAQLLAQTVAPRARTNGWIVTDWTAEKAAPGEEAALWEAKAPDESRGVMLMRSEFDMPDQSRRVNVVLVAVRRTKAR
jgi:hypothetical protein